MQPRTALKPILILRKALQRTENNLICSGVYRGPAAKSAPDCAGGQGHSRRPAGRGSDWAASGAGGGEVGDSLQSGPGRIYPQTLW